MKKQSLYLAIFSLLLVIIGCKKNHEANVNQPPEVWAGPTKIVFLPLDSVELKGLASDPDGSITSYEWTKTIGPSSPAIISPSNLNTSVRGLVQGVYIFQLKVTDNGGLSAVDHVAVHVDTLSNAGPNPWDY